MDRYLDNRGVQPRAGLQTKSLRIRVRGGAADRDKGRVAMNCRDVTGLLGSTDIVAWATSADSTPPSKGFGLRLQGHHAVARTEAEERN